MAIIDKNPNPNSRLIIVQGEYKESTRRVQGEYKESARKKSSF